MTCCILFYIVHSIFLVYLWWSSLLNSFCLLWHMSAESSIYVGFADGASLHTQNSTSAAWVIYIPISQVLSWGGLCLQPSSNNVAEYSAIIELLWDAISYGVLSLEVRLDSQLVVSQLHGLYRIRDLTLLRRFLRVRLLEWQFDNITYMYVSRIFNQVVDSYANYVLDWHLFHTQ